MTTTRTTITIDDDVLSHWREISKIQGASLSSVISDWLEDTADAAKYKAVSIHAQSMKVKDVTRRMVVSLRTVEESYAAAIGRAAGTPGRALAGTSGTGALPPRPSNTGGKLPKARGVRDQ